MSSVHLAVSVYCITMTCDSFKSCVTASKVRRTDEEMGRKRIRLHGYNF